MEKVYEKNFMISMQKQKSSSEEIINSVEYEDLCSSQGREVLS